MKHLLSSLLVIATMSTLSQAHAQQAKIIKVKGQQAIVQFPNGTAPTVGQMIDVGGGGGDGATSSAPMNGRRDHLLGLSASLTAASSSAGGSQTNLNFTGRYGWNQAIMEFGPIVNLAYSSTPGRTDRTLGAGGYFDFNFVENRSGVPLVYGVGAELNYGQQTTTIAAVDSSTSLLELFAGGNLKWFGLSDHFALRGDAGLDVFRSTPSTGTATTLTGLSIKAGLAVYF